jgi:1,4-dihydroxy-2-naphthoate octaprenyltransferase
VNLTARELSLFLRLSRPHYLVLGALLYGLGAAAGDYLAFRVDASVFMVGLILVLAIQLMTHYLVEYNQTVPAEEYPHPTPFSGRTGTLGGAALPRQTALAAAVITLGIGTTTASAFLVTGHGKLISWILLLLIFLGAYSFSAAPFRLQVSGLGELILSITVAVLLPAYGYALQTGELHRLLWMITTPLAALHMAMMIAVSVPDYVTNLKHNRRVLMVRLGWQTALRLHDVAVLFAILSMALALALGLPWRVVGGLVLVFPLAAAQVWQMARIRAGLPPQYRYLAIGGVALFLLSSYILLVGFLLA